ncbi:unnamed protein product [Ambrosiozyma monospora]|uniref:Unnamed protein product n=1 Tax=Ambrosiozyma monospora TaxID=43982 RepID=A0ACB5SRF3_AMBMO|nr:unnamed protein product [Ambrosiozyma monospora]
MLKLYGTRNKAIYVPFPPSNVNHPKSLPQPIRHALEYNIEEQKALVTVADDKYDIPTPFEEMIKSPPRVTMAGSFGQ